MKWVTVDDMYNSAKSANTELLSDYASAYWAEYRSKHNYYDRLFRRMFNSFRFFDQTPLTTAPSAEHIADVQEEFTDAVYDFLLVNDKKFAELYRVNVIDDEKYSIFNNYDIIETKEEERSSEGTDNIGAKSVTDTNTYGSATDSNTHVEAQRQDSATHTEGQRTDTEQISVGAKTISEEDVVGAKTISEEDVVGAKTISEEDVVGARTDSDTATVGAQNNTKETGIAGFNSSTYSDADLVTESLGTRSDTAGHTQGQQTNTKSVQEGAQTNSKSIQEGAQSNSKSIQEGAQSNSKSIQKGAQSDTDAITKGEVRITDTKNIGGRSDTLASQHSAQENTFERGDTTAYTLTRKGNIGVRTVTEILAQHKEFWSMWEFYSYIFKEICADLLLI